MIDLFATPAFSISSRDFTNLLHDEVVRTFEHEFAAYVGAKYACAVHSETAAILMLFKELYSGQTIRVPSIIPPVVPTTLVQAGCEIEFTDDTEWVGWSYTLHEDSNRKIVDSAQRVEKGQYKREALSDKDVFLYSHYPTKPVGSVDGGTIVTNDVELMGRLRQLCFNGTSPRANSWERDLVRIGWKLYMNSIQAHVALDSLGRLEGNLAELERVRAFYNLTLGLNNRSSHLYRVEVEDRPAFMRKAVARGISCGVHYSALHEHSVFRPYSTFSGDSEKVEAIADRTVSIPFHPYLRETELISVANLVKEFKEN